MLSTSNDPVPVHNRKFDYIPQWISARQHSSTQNSLCEHQAVNCNPWSWNSAKPGHRHTEYDTSTSINLSLPVPLHVSSSTLYQFHWLLVHLQVEYKATIVIWTGACISRRQHLHHLRQRLPSALIGIKRDMRCTMYATQLPDFVLESLLLMACIYMESFTIILATWNIVIFSCLHCRNISYQHICKIMEIVKMTSSGASIPGGWESNFPHF